MRGATSRTATTLVLPRIAGASPKLRPRASSLRRPLPQALRSCPTLTSSATWISSARRMNACGMSARRSTTVRPARPASIATRRSAATAKHRRLPASTATRRSAAAVRNRRPPTRPNAACVRSARSATRKSAGLTTSVCGPSVTGSPGTPRRSVTATRSAWSRLVTTPRNAAASARNAAVPRARMSPPLLILARWRRRRAAWSPWCASPTARRGVASARRPVA